MTSAYDRLLDAVAAVSLAREGDVMTLTAEFHRQIRAGLGLPDVTPDEPLTGGTLNIRSLVAAGVDPVAQAEAMHAAACELASRLGAVCAVAGMLARGESLAAVGLKLAFMPEDE